LSSTSSSIAAAAAAAAAAAEYIKHSVIKFKILTSNILKKVSLIVVDSVGDYHSYVIYSSNI
jgi:hypothetical protein